MDQLRRKTTVAWLSVASNAILVALKLTVGMLIGSVSVISEAIHSSLDLAAAVIALVAVRHSGKPADSRHPFGHGKIENISGAIEALLIFLAAGWIYWEAIDRLVDGHFVRAPALGVAVMAFSAIANTLVSRALFRVGRDTESIALQADAVHLRADVWTSLGVMAGLGAIWLGERLWPGAHLHWLDPVAALAVALLIGRAAWTLTRDAARDLLDESLPPDEVAWLDGLVGRLDLPVAGIHDLRTRRAGPYRFIEMHVEVNGNMSVHESHEIADAIEHAIVERFPRGHAIVHVDPYDDSGPVPAGPAGGRAGGRGS